MPTYTSAPMPASACAPSSVQAVASTWERNTNGLFDFEGRQINEETFTMAGPTAFVRSGSSVQMVDEQQLPSVEGDRLLRVVKRSEGGFWVVRASESAQRPWIVVRDLAAHNYHLAEGDVIKLGSIKVRVRQLVADAPGAAALPDLCLDDADENLAADTTTAMEDNRSSLCRICLCEGSSEDDPLIAPCRCKGSIECVHVGCLRHWIHGRLNLTDRPGSSYTYRPLSCELCKSAYPTFIASQSGQEKKRLVEVPPMQPPFMVLENMTRDAQHGGSRGLHVISLADRALKLGRSHDSGLRIADVSISRLHATIHFKHGNFVLEDNNSRFGTFVAMKRARRLEPGTQLSVQTGRTVLKLTAASTALDIDGISFAAEVDDILAMANAERL